MERVEIFLYIAYIKTCTNKFLLDTIYFLAMIIFVLFPFYILNCMYLVMIHNNLLGCFMQTKHHCVFIHFRYKVRMAIIKMFKTSSIFTDRSNAVLLLLIHFVIDVSCSPLLCYVYLVCSLQRYDHLLGNG